MRLAVYRLSVKYADTFVIVHVDAIEVPDLILKSNFLITKIYF